MVQQCLEEKMPIAICHTEKIIHEAPPAETTKEALSKNQDTYKPFPIFSAGLCELVSITNDGRLLINVYVDRRLELIEEVQTLPFTIAKCRPYLDTVLQADEISAAEILKDKILHRLIAFAGNDKDVIHRLESDEWQQKSAQAFSFEVFSIIQLEPDLQQSILEDRSALSRLQRVLDVLNEKG